MLAKLKYLKEEEKALKDIEMMVTEQVTRLKQEELYLKSLLKESGGKHDEILSSSSLDFTKQAELLDDNKVNAVPLDDLQLKSHQQIRFSDTEDHEEEDDEDEMDSRDCNESQDEDGINKDLMALMQHMQGSDSYEDDEC